MKINFKQLYKALTKLKNNNKPNAQQKAFIYIKERQYIQY